MQIQVTTLSENTANHRVLAEYGLSILVEADGQKVLFDTGLSFSAIYNAQLLGVDLSTVDRIVLSHAHPDHTGGLRQVLKRVGQKEVIAHPANLVLPYCQRSMITRALENQVFTATANRTGSEERLPGKSLQFTGASRLVGPDGKVIAEGPPDQPAVITAEIDPQLALDKNITPVNNVLTDRRPDQYRL